jgi:branched-subunit amino acid transport protein
MTTWIAVLGAGIVSYLLKLTGYTVPNKWLETPRVSRITSLLPASLLAALVVLQTFATGPHLILDARAAGLIAAAIALTLRAPFIVVVIVAAATAAGFRALGWAA